MKKQADNKEKEVTIGDIMAVGAVAVWLLMLFLKFRLSEQEKKRVLGELDVEKIRKFGKAELESYIKKLIEKEDYEEADRITKLISKPLNKNKK